MNKHIVVSMLVIGFTTPLNAQQTLTASEGSRAASSSTAPAVADACNYDGCSLRLAILGLGSWNVVQGVESRKVGRLGLFRAPNIDNLVRAVPEAVDEARHFRRSYGSSAAFLWGGGAIAMVGSGLSARNGGDPVAVGLSISGLALMTYGAWNHAKSFNHLSRSLWLYNRSLTR